MFLRRIRIENVRAVAEAHLRPKSVYWWLAYCYDTSHSVAGSAK